MDTLRKSSSISHSSKLCIASSRRCIQQLTKEDDTKGSILTSLTSEESRFILWASNIVVFGDVQDSLDYHLRNVPDITELFLTQLATIDARLQQRRSLLGNDRYDAHTKSLEVSELDATNKAQPDDDVDTEYDYKGTLDVDSEVEDANEIMESIHSSIGWLHRLANLFRKASSSHRLHDTDTAEEFRLTDENALQSEHMMRWHCLATEHESPCYFESPGLLKDHFLEQHKDKLTTDEMDLLCTTSGHPINPLLSSCPFCDSHGGEQADHVAQHLRRLALRSLPWPDDAESGSISRESYDDTGSSKSTRQTLRAMEDELPILDEFFDQGEAEPNRLNTIGLSVLSQENYQKPDKEVDTETVDGLHFMEEGYNPTQDHILRNFMDFNNIQPTNNVAASNTSSGTSTELVLTRRNTDNNKVHIDVVPYDTNENVGFLKDRLRRMFGFTDKASLVFLVPNESSQYLEARDLPDEEYIGSFFPNGGAAELGLGGKDQKQGTGGYNVEHNKATDTAKQRNIIAVENLATATSRGGIQRCEAEDGSRQVSLITNSTSGAVFNGIYD
ncbi:hypothetical protein PG985_012067 [Apiospora marii]|uniref:uncharacterized protein n=1 Tax=Apiospora marii TaxID=335849 RepID=UPI0031323D98